MKLNEHALEIEKVKRVKETEIQKIIDQNSVNMDKMKSINLKEIVKLRKEYESKMQYEISRNSARFRLEGKARQAGH